MPLFSPVYSTTRPYSQTRSNTQRDLLQADEFLRLDRYKCVVMFNHYKPAQLYKVMLEELPEYKNLHKCSIFEYIPDWKKREDAEKERRAAEKQMAREAAARISPPVEPPAAKQPPVRREKKVEKHLPSNQTPSQHGSFGGMECIYDIPSMKGASPEDIGLVEMTRSAIIASDDPELEEFDDPTRIPPGRGI